MPKRYMVVDRLKALNLLDKEQIRQCVLNSGSKFIPAKSDMKILLGYFNTINNQTLEYKCSLCRKRVLNFWINVVKNDFGA